MLLTDVPLVEPVLVWTTDEYGLSPLLTVTFEAAAVGDVLLLEISTLADFSVHAQLREQHIGRGRGRGRDADVLAVARS